MATTTRPAIPAESNVSADALIAESYWKSLSYLDDGVKLRLAAMLTTSVAEKAESKESSDELTKRMLKKYYGAWQGDETADDIMSAIRENSTIRGAVQL